MIAQTRWLCFALVSLSLVTVSVYYHLVLRLISLHVAHPFSLSVIVQYCEVALVFAFLALFANQYPN